MPLLAALLALLFWLSALIRLAAGMRRIGSLAGVPPAPNSGCPSLSVVVPACNEGATIEPALRSLLALDYPFLEVVVVNDRSTDGTGETVVRLAGEDARLKPMSVEDLPSGWLGKNHALHVGSGAANGDWLLFTDADVVYEPDTMRRVMAWVERDRLDHAVALPRIVVNGFWERLFVLYFLSMFNYRFRPWAAGDPNSGAYMGVGAFNLVRTATYRRMGGHALLPLEIADDIKLGKLLKASGARTGVIDGSSGLAVRWVEGLRGVVLGLEKNTFAGMGFRLDTVLLSTVAILVAQVFPPLGLLAGGPTAILSALSLACMAAVAAVMAPAAWAPDRPASTLAVKASSDVRRAAAWQLPAAVWGLAFPLAALLFLFVMARSTWLAYQRGAVLWRGTPYPLDELRRGVV